MKSLILAFLLSCLLSIILGAITIPFLRRLKAGQTVLKYVKEHEGKNGTPTMGGLFFIASCAIIFLIFGGYKARLGLVALIIGIAFMLVGFIDDFIKIKYKKNEGLTALQKIFFQVSIAVLAGFFAYYNGLTIFYIPFVKKTVDLGIFSVFLIVVIFLATTNSVNLTDGLDGLAGSTSAVYLLAISLLIFVETSAFNNLYFESGEYDSLILLSVSLVGSILGFLAYNVNKAKVFMGDTGSLALGGFIASISIFSSNSLFIAIIGVMFVISSLSVILQVARFKKSGKRFFLMAPIHHHFQMKGMSEGQISYIYSVITCIMGALTIIFYI